MKIETLLRLISWCTVVGLFAALVVSPIILIWWDMWLAFRIFATATIWTLFWYWATRIVEGALFSILESKKKEENEQKGIQQNG